MTNWFSGAAQLILGLYALRLLETFSRVLISCCWSWSIFMRRGFNDLIPERDIQQMRKLQ